MRGRRGQLMLDAACAAGAALVSVLVAVVTVGFGDDRWRRPLDLANDANLNAMLVKGVVDHGWALENPNLGAPFTQQLHDFPFADNLSLVLIRALAIFTSDWALVMNLFYVLTFALVAVTAYAVARLFSVGRLPATALAVLYSVAPYHFLRGEQHLFLSNYASVPLATALLLAAARGLGWRWTRWSIVAAAIAGFVLAGSVQYYPLFTVGLLLVVAVARALARRRWNEGVPGVALAAWIVVAFAIHLAPNLWYRFSHGANTDVAQRTLGETAIFSFRLTDLFVPMANHRLDGFASLHARVAAAFGPPPEFGAPALGTIASLALLGLLVVTVAGLAGRGGRTAFRTTDRHLALLAVVSLLVGTTGGLAAVLAATVGAPLRAWNRLSIFLAYFALLAAARLVTRVAARLRGPVATGAFAIGIVAATVLGILDQTSPAFRPSEAAADADAATWALDESFVDEVEDVLPEGAAVLELPYLQFPENGPYHRMADYDPVRGYLHSDDLRWSYGGVRRRPQDFQRAMSHLPPDAMVRAAVAAGFDGIWLDRFGMPTEADAYQAGLTDVLGGPPMVRADGRIAFFSLVDARRRLRPDAELRRRVLSPPTFAIGRGFQPPEADFDHRWVWMGEQAALVVDNPLDEPRTVAFDAEMETGSGGPETLFVDGRPFAVPGGGKTVRFTVDLDPGEHRTVTLRTTAPFVPPTGPDRRDLRLQLIDLRATDEAVL